jgi:formylglycine-generating enzyme required for sulfatase activity
LGNGQEWTQTIWGSRERECDYPYPYRPDDGREQTPVDDVQTVRALRVHRGGSLRSAATEVSGSARAAADPLSKVTWRGFRVVMTLPDTSAGR